MSEMKPTRRALMAAALLPAAAIRGTAANSELTVGLIGCGGRGTYDATLLAKEVPGARLTAVADIFPDRVERAKKTTGVEGLKGYASGSELLSASGVDAVIIATPVYLHPEHLEAAIKAGKHIYMEKPAGADVAGVKRMMRAADAAPRTLNITFGFQQRYGPGYRKAKALVDSGGIGRVVAAHAYWVKYQVTQNPPKTRPVTDEEKAKQWHEWRDLFGDYIVENNVHGIDVLNWFLNAHPTRAVGSGGRTLIDYGDNTDHSYVTFDYPNNVQGHLNGTMIAPRFYRDVKEQFFGEKGVVETHRELWKHYRGPNDVVEEKEKRPDITANALEEFVQRVKEGRPENTAHSAAESTLTAILGRMATDARREVTWDEMMKTG